MHDRDLRNLKEERMPEATVAAIITKHINQKIKILLTHRDHYPFNNKWCIPGGHIEKQESVYDAVVREIKEETELDFKGKFFKYFEELFPDISIHNVVLVFIGTATGKLPNRTNEVDEFLWIDLNEALKINLAFNHNEILNEYKRSIRNETK